MPSLIQELYLSNASITGKGLACFSLIQENRVPFALQILDLSYNDLGSDSPNMLECVIPHLISLNLAHTKMASRGAFNLA